MKAIDTNNEVSTSLPSTPNGLNILDGKKIFLGLLVLYCAQRLWVVFTGRCPLNSDEAIISLMASDLLDGRFSPFFYGQDYLGCFVALCIAPLKLLFGPYPLASRIASIIQGAAVLLVWRWLFARWNFSSAWVFFALLFALAPEFTTLETLKCGFSTVEIVLLGSLWLVVLTVLIESHRPFRLQTSLFFLLGLVSGFGWWTSQMVFFFYIPGVLLFLACGFKSRRLTLSEPPSWKTEVVAWSAVILYLATLAVLVARGSLHWRSPLSAILYNWRWLLIVTHVLSILIFLLVWKRIRFAIWPVATGMGFLIGYLPALSVVLFKPTLYNKHGLPETFGFFTNLWSLFLNCTGSLIGVLDGSLQPTGLPLALVIAVIGVYFASMIMVYLDLARLFRRGERVPTWLAFTALALPVSVVLFGLIQSDISAMPRYAFCLVFFMNLATACFLANLWKANRAVSAIMLAVLLIANCHSVINCPSTPVTFTRMVPLNDQELIDFLLSKGIDVACTSLDSEYYGYWEAYRLTVESGGRIKFHPVLHMPRIDSYRVQLQNAEKCAIVTIRPDEVEDVFDKNHIQYLKTTFGLQTAFTDFDKRQVDALGLIDYRRSLLEPRR